MNANELAYMLWENYLDNNECEHGFALSSGCHNDDCKEQALYDAATMLRQQQAKLTKYELRHAEQRKRIEELEKDLYMLERHYDQLEGDLQIAGLRKREK